MEYVQRNLFSDIIRDLRNIILVFLMLGAIWGVTTTPVMEFISAIGSIALRLRFVKYESVTFGVSGLNYGDQFH